MPRDVWVLGLDELNLRLLGELPHLNDYRFHSLLDLAELRTDGEVDIEALLEEARRRLDASSAPVDAIVGYWDFPVSSMLPLLCDEYGVRGASLESVLKCEHKYWSRLEQAEVIEEYPAFGLVPLEGEPKPPEGVRYPMWLKPVKSASSALAFLVHDDAELRDAVDRIRAGVDEIGEPFAHLMRYVDLPEPVAAAGGSACLAEEAIDGAQVTVEGFVQDGRVCVYGVVDSIMYPGTPSFLRYQYPSTLPDRVLDRLSDISARVVKRVGLDHTAFNIEFFWDELTDDIRLLEVNPRHSQSHAPLFAFVDGTPNHQCMVRLGLGLPPEVPQREGPHAIAAKWLIRRFSDAVVLSVPSRERIEAIREEIPDAIAEVLVKPGERLSERPMQDGYSYELGWVYLGARTEAELTEKYRRCLKGLAFAFEDVEHE
ncbi:MAG: ATP-grasp domain-containing protein [Streptosporangiales bacterium]|nr:ATP-grasp domain-containing protein [Streptosporangiales bacterium]